jgi:hypothetical protein
MTEIVDLQLAICRNNELAAGVLRRTGDRERERKRPFDPSC